MPPGEGIRLELVEENELSGGTADGAERPRRYRAIVNCGKPVRGMEIEIRGTDGEVLPNRGIGRVFVRGTSVMHSYFRDEESTRACLSSDGWLDTGDMGYLSDGYIFIVGRAKDMIIINGRNHWPQDIEWAVQLSSSIAGSATRKNAVACATTSVSGFARLPAYLRSSS
jgi:fatty-acyl-CoA synthase